MKKVYLVFGAAFAIIAACMIYLVWEGVSLRTEPIIKPSPIDGEYKNISFGVIHRLFPDFQKSDYVVWGMTPYTSEEAKVLELLQNEHLVQLSLKPTLLQISDKTTAEELKACPKPCWIITAKELASDLGVNPLIAQVKAALGENYFSVTLLEFELGLKVPPECETEKRLDYTCMLPVSVREVRRRIDEDGPRQFFMRRYNEKDTFLFLQKRKFR